MNEPEKRYLASDLVTELGVPRSTVNDWLTRYADFLESEAVGKRRAYSGRSLAVLKSVSELRNAGAGSFEIEKALTARYGVRPEIAPVPPETEVAPEAKAGMPAVRTNFDELAARVSGEFLSIGEKIEELEKERRLRVRRMTGFFFLCFSLLAALALLLGGALWCVYLKMHYESQRQQRKLSELSGSNAALRQFQESSESQRRDAEQARLREIGELSDALGRASTAFQSDLSRLSGELAAQRKEHELRIREMEKSSALRLEAEKRKIRDEFAGKQLKKLRELEARASGTQQLRRELDRSRKNEQERKKEIEKLKKRIAELEKQKKTSPKEVKP